MHGGSYPRNPACIFIILIKSEFMPDINKDDHTRGDTNCQAKDVYQGKRFVFKQVSPGNDQVVFDHGKQLGE
jgi:hypothetical protein